MTQQSHLVDRPQREVPLMSDSLRDRIAAAIVGDGCPCFSCTAVALEKADAVIRELADQCRAGCMWQIPNRIEDMTEAQRTILSAQRAIDEHNARDRSHWTEGEQ